MVKSLGRCNFWPVRFWSALASSVAGKKSVHFERRAPFLTVKAKIDGRELQLLVDSGTPGILIYRKRFEPVSERLNSDNTLVETATGPSQSEWFLASSVSLGNENLGRRRVVIADADPVADDFDGLLGLVNLGFHRVTLTWRMDYWDGIDTGRYPLDLSLADCRRPLGAFLSLYSDCQVRQLCAPLRSGSA
jgi:Aspartyl protease